MYRLEFSPPKPPPKKAKKSRWSAEDVASPEAENDERPVVILESFSPVAHLSFSKVKLGFMKSCYLFVQNPKPVPQRVKIDKFPADKGFSIEIQEFTVDAGEERALKIDWIPEKSCSCRGIISFTTSLGCKTQAVLLGTAYSPKKMVKKIIAGKNHNVHPRKKSLMVNQTYDKSVSKAHPPKISEERKENCDINSESLFSNFPDFSSSKFKFSPADVKEPFSLKITDCADSPIRRQTYTINTMLSHGRESEVLPFSSKECNSAIPREQTWRKGQAASTLNSSTFKNQSVGVISHPSLQRLQSNDDFNDSLETNNMKSDDVSITFNDSLVEFDSKRLESCLDFTGVHDKVETYDKATKHLLFGVTPEQPKHFPDILLNDQSLTSFNDGKTEAHFVGMPAPCLKEESIFKQPFSLIDGKKFLSCDFGCESATPSNHSNCLNFSEPAVSYSNQDLSVDGFAASGTKFHIPFSENVPKETKNPLSMEIFCDDPSSKTTFTNSSKSCVSRMIKSADQSALKNKVLKQKSHDVESKPAKESAVLQSNRPCKRKLVKYMPHKLALAKSRVSEPIVYQRNPFATMNAYYDEHWIEKQEAAFTSWLNFILTPNDDFGSEDVKVDSAKLWIESIKESSAIPAPTKEELSLRAYTAARNLNLLRSSSFSLYQSNDIVAVIKKIEKEVDLKKLSIRKDKAIHADLGIKKHILEMLLSYNTLWLRIGLETVYGEIINLQSNSDVLGLSRFIIHRFLQNPELSAKFCHPAVIKYYKKGYEDEINRFILKKFLLLVFYLDKAKTGHLIKHNPCLFNKTSKYKSSRDLLLAFSREYLSGEGDITKHLRYLGYKVSHVQTALEEFDFSVRNLSTDLRCGLRLGRIVELLLQDWSISLLLRVNTLNRLTKIHNNDVILKALRNASIEIENNIEAKHITDGDREKTLDLLWQIIFKTQISKLVNKDLLKKENVFLLKCLKLKADFAAFNALRNNAAGEQEIHIHNSKLYKENEILQLLFHWCQNVCAHYGVKIHNFTSSFSDGRALCLLLHHYHPNVLPIELIKFDTSSSFFEKQMEVAELEESCPFFSKNGQSYDLMEKLLKNERDNLALVFQKFQEVGHIPILSCPMDISNTMPDEKVMVTLVSYINIRLMELSIEIRAARKILHAWRRYKFRKQQEKLKLEIQAVGVIQRAWRKFVLNRKLKRETRASTVMQSFWRMILAKRQLSHLKEQKLHKNATIIQAVCRGFLARKHLQRCHQAAITIQTCFRRYSAESKFRKLKNVTIKLQQKHRAKVEGKIQLLKYLNYQKMIKKRSARIIQKAWKKYVVSRRVKLENRASILIQSFWRMYLAKKVLANLKQERLEMLTKKAIIIQAAYRGYCVRKHILVLHKAAVVIQRNVRGFLALSHFVKLKSIAVLIQQKYRAKVVGRAQRLKYLNYKKMIRQKSARIIQKGWRNYRENKAAVVIQCSWRMYCAKKAFELLKEEKRIQWITANAVIIQAAYRGYLVRKQVKKWHAAAVVIQKHVRRMHAQAYFMKLRKTTLLMQQIYRAKVMGRAQRMKYLSFKSMVRLRAARVIKEAWKNHKRNKAAIVIQSFWRMCSAMKALEILKQQRQDWLNHNAVIIQSAFRGYLVRKQVSKCHAAAIVIQSHVRMMLVRSHFLKLKNATLKIQKIRRAKIIGRAQRMKYLHFKRMVCLRAARIIKNAWKNHKRNRASTVIQKYWRMHSAKKVLALLRKQRQEWLNYNAVIIQAAFRGFIVRKWLSQCHRAATVIQKNFRCWRMQHSFILQKKSTVLIQRKYRATVLGRIQRQKYLSFQKMVKTRAARIIQKAWVKRKENKAATVIQCIWRMYLSRKKLAYLKEQKMLSEKATIIQSTYRGYLVRKHLLKLHLASTVIQKHFRGWRAYSQFIKLKSVTLKLQQIRRAKVVGRMQRTKYLSFRNMIQNRAAKTIQRAWRKRKQNQAATVIQCYFRMYLAKQELAYRKKARFELLTLSATIIQSAYRGYLVRKSLHKSHQAAATIQKYYRGWKCRSSYVKLRALVLKIQQKHRAKVSGRAQRLKYLSYRQMIRKRAARLLQKAWRKNRQNKASICIQSYWRMHSAKKELAALRQQKFELMTKNATLIQAAYRGFLVRRDMRKLHQAATVVQKDFRKWHAQSHYNKLRSFTVKIQQIHRARVTGRAQRQKYLSFCTMVNRRAVRVIENAWILKKRNRAATVIQSNWKMYAAKKKLACLKQQRLEWLSENATCIQAFYRGYLVRKHLKKLHQAATTIQKCYRGWKAYSKFVFLKKSVICLQQKYRAKVIGRTQRLKYLNYKRMVKHRASRTIQLAWRKRRENKASTIIQSYWRMYSAKKKLVSLKQERFELLTRSATAIQAYFRGFVARRNLILCHKAACLIQANFRRWQAQLYYEKLKYYTVRIQQIHRAKSAGRIQRLKFINYRKMIQNRAARVIQTAWKRRKENIAATVIQNFWRMHCAKKELAFLRKERHELLNTNATIIQAAYRGYVIRRKMQLHHKSATIIQKHFRRWCVHSHFIKLKSVVSLLQQKHRARVAGRVQRSKYLSYRTMVQVRAAKTIQRAWRKQKQIRACTVIQSYWRMICAQKILGELKKQRWQWIARNAIVIQSSYRSYVVRKYLKKCHHAATTIQKIFRGWLTRSHYLKMKKITTKIQRNYRAKKACKIQRAKYLNYKNMIKRRAVRIIQKAWRLYLLNRENRRKHSAATIIQKSWKMYQAKKQLELLKEHKRLQLLNQNAIKIQAAFRGFTARRHLMKQHAAATIIQKHYRRWHAYSQYSKLKSIVLKIQRIFRAKVIGRMQRRKYLSYCSMIHERAAKKIQRAWRNNKKTKCSIVIQSYWRMQLAKRKLAYLKEEKRLQWLSQKVILIQAFYRGYSVRIHIAKCHQAASIIQNHFRLWLIRRKLQPLAAKQRAEFVAFRKSLVCFQQTARSFLRKRQNAATKIQAYWRAYQVRKVITDKKICEAREKILAADNSESNKLKNRTTRSLELLFKDTVLQHMIAALEDLDVCTQLSPNCCMRLVQSGGVSILLYLVQRCNRSIPHMELIKLTTNILLNLAKYEKTVSYVWEEKHILETVLCLMKIFREKGVAIFSKCCSLLWIFCQDPDKAQAMKENSALCEQIRSFHYLLTRKQTIEAKRQVAKAIANKSFSIAPLKSCNTSTIQKGAKRESLQIDPDWMLGRHRRREFQDPIVAITWIMKFLDLKSK